MNEREYCQLGLKCHGPGTAQQLVGKLGQLLPKFMQLYSYQPFSSDAALDGK